jgi:NADPH:quinone reductase-like Zn-dependent oxidoreductase
MKAAVCMEYGQPEAVQIMDVARPTPADNEVLIRVRAASLNPLDWHLKRGAPYMMRFMTGLRKPRDPRLGVDVAGQVEAAGRRVTQFKPGDAVFGSCRGAFAEYVCSAESKLVRKPDNVSFEQAASVPVAAFTALQGLRDKGHIQAGQKVLVNGAAGGVGTFTVQIAKTMGAEVTGVCSTRNLELVRSLGADRVIDYTKEDFTQGGQRYDLIFDLVGNHSWRECRRALSPKGICIAAGILGGFSPAGFLTRSISALVLSPFVSQNRVMLLARGRKEDLAAMCELLESRKVTPVIDKCYALSAIPEAIRHLEGKHARGKIVITV